MTIKIKKRRKSKGQRGNTHYHGARKKWKGSGHHGGVGMAGTGKRADQKKTLVTKLYGNKYFGKQGITCRSTERKKLNVINLGDIQKNFDSLMKKSGKNNILEMKDYKILGDGEFDKGIKIIAKAFSESARDKIKKAGGEAVLAKKKKEEENEEKILKEEKIEKKPKERKNKEEK